MSVARTIDYLNDLVNELRRRGELEWVEFKHNKFDPQEVGENISALANSATLNGQSYGYMVWGVEDGTRDLVGTTFDPRGAKKGSEPLETWLLRLLEPRIDFRFHCINCHGERVVILEIACAVNQPVRFNGKDYVRIGPVKKPMKDVPERERELWRAFDRTRFETMASQQNMKPEDILRILDYPAYFDLLNVPLPENRDGIIEALAGDDLIRKCNAGGWDICNLGAVLFAKNLRDFPELQRKAMRVIRYSGSDRTKSANERHYNKGYAAGFGELAADIADLLPSREVIEGALRKTIHEFPPLATRELVANALIHQDFTITGAGPMLEIFDDRLVITNPGEPLIDLRRFVDTPPKSRNEALASMMRRLGFSEERGSGIDKALVEVEELQLPTLLFDVPDGFTRAVLYARKNLKDMSKQDKIWAVYLHACLRYVKGSRMTNATLRRRFGVASQNTATISRLLNEAIDAGMIVVENPTAGTRSRAYLPFWAASGRERFA